MNIRGGAQAQARALVWLLVVCAFSLALQACVGMASRTVEVAVPAADQRAYRYVELDNGLKVLLVSDPGADKAAAALDVHVGSAQDPRDRQGLAHFLEHMLFLGTEQYPEAGEYQSFINARGGSHNAYTAFEHTNYFFDVSADALEGALDRFAQFFVAPLFNSEYVQREVNAVESEYRARILDDRRRELDVLKELANPGHPFSKFPVGSLGTLLGGRGEASLRQALLDFYARYYSADLMSLVVIGREPLDELESMVRPRFSPVPNHAVNIPDISEPVFGTTPLWINLRPHTEQRNLSISFQVPDTEALYREKPFNYIGNILGHEGEGSLLSLLKERGWAESFSAGQGYEYRGGGVFGFDIRLTEAGLEHVDEVVALVFQSIRLLREDGIDAWRYREQTVLGEQQFRFRAEGKEIHDASRFAHYLQQFPPEDVIRGPYIMTRYDAGMIRDMLGYLTPDKAVVSVSVPGLEGERESELYGVPYTLRRMPAATLEQWQQQPIAPPLVLPEPNPFIAEQFSLKTDAPPADAPYLLRDTGAVETWFLQDREFHLPKGTLYLQLRSPVAANTAQHRAYTELWAGMVDDELNEAAYPAQLAGLSFELRSTREGLELVVHGFDQKQAVLLERLLAVLSKPGWDPQRFERLRAEQVRQLVNQRELEPYRLLGNETRRLLQRDAWQLEPLIKATSTATLADVVAHAQAVLHANTLTLLAFGNYTEGDVRQFAQLAGAALRSDTVPAVQTEDIVHLKPGELVDTVASQHQDAAVLLYLQAPEVSKSARVAMGLTGQMLSAEFFHALRTQKQLGYIVSASVFPLREVPALIFVAQSPVADAQQLQREFNDFIANWVQQLPGREAFEQHKATLLKRLAESPQNQWEAGQRYWQDLLDGYRRFDSREQLATALQALSYEDWLARMREYLGGSQRRALWFATTGRWPDKGVAGRSIGDFDAFKARQVYYQFGR